jgi:hypothetical protein
MGTPLRKEAPITQKPAPVYQSQPVATTYQGKNRTFTLIRMLCAENS